ncbi:MAG: hypothetical protein JSV75_01635 [Candidatus Bathyarchaeota archaeon]|nr:MAG: hypothetical protein JSV75_01635 [Candidatus Bathyarchaeota archaeon]
MGCKFSFRPEYEMGEENKNESWDVDTKLDDRWRQNLQSKEKIDVHNVYLTL